MCGRTGPHSCDGCVESRASDCLCGHGSAGSACIILIARLSFFNLCEYAACSTRCIDALAFPTSRIDVLSVAVAVDQPYYPLAINLFGRCLFSSTLGGRVVYIACNARINTTFAVGPDYSCIVSRILSFVMRVLLVVRYISGQSKGRSVFRTRNLTPPKFSFSAALAVKTDLRFVLRHARRHVRGGRIRLPGTIRYLQCGTNFDRERQQRFVLVFVRSILVPTSVARRRSTVTPSCLSSIFHPSRRALSPTPVVNFDRFFFFCGLVVERFRLARLWSYSVYKLIFGETQNEGKL